MLEVKNLGKDYGEGREKITVFSNVSCHIEKGDVVGIVGPSGCGKTTFIQCLMSLVRADRGEIWFGNQNIMAKDADIRAYRRKVGMVFQDFNLFGHMTVLENITLAPIIVDGMSQEEADKEAMRLLRMVGLAECAGKYPDQLSGGQKQRVAIARCLAMKPEIILFDEPTSALDPAKKKEVAAVIKKLAQKGMTMVIVSHEHKLIQRVCNKVFFFCQGELYEQGTLDEVFGNPKRMLTKAYVQNIFGMKFTVLSRDYDLYALNSEIGLYCQNNGLHDYENTLELISEEMLTNILPYTGPISIILKLGHDNKPSFTIIQENCSESVMNNPLADEVSLSIVKGLCLDIEEKQDGYSRNIKFSLK